MSRKNHELVDGRLLQTDKKYSNLKLKQKEKIAQWMYTETKAYYDKYSKAPEGEDCNEIVEHIYDRIEAAEIWIPFDEVYRHYMKRKSDLTRRVKQELGLAARKQSVPACFMNLCIIRDVNGSILMVNKADEKFNGVTFPGGYVETEETFAEAVIRSVQADTGLIINQPVLCGIYHWTKAGVRNVVFLYRTGEFEGELRCPEERKVFWVPENELLAMKLAPGIKQIWEIMGSSVGEEYCNQLAEVMAQL